MFQQTNPSPVQPPVMNIKDEKDQASVVKPPANENVYIMPDKFHPTPAKSSASRPLIIATIILVLLVISTSTYFLLSSWQKNQNVTPVANQEVVVANTNVYPEEPNANLTNGEVMPEIPTTTEVTETTTPATTTPPAPPVAPVTLTPPPTSKDSDNDGLTDLEEAVLGINPNKPDSDGDNFIDGIEVANGYSPTIAGSGANTKLAADTHLSILKTNFAADNFTTLYPKVWKTGLVPENKQALITTDSGEIIRISVRDNSPAISAMNWYLQDHPEILVDQLKPVTVGNLDGFFTPDRLTAYLSDPQRTKLYVFEYLMNNPQAEFRYPALFSLIISNFKLATTTANNATSTDGQ